MNKTEEDLVKAKEILQQLIWLVEKFYEWTLDNKQSSDLNLSMELKKEPKLLDPIYQNNTWNKVQRCDTESKINDKVCNNCENMFKEFLWKNPDDLIERWCVGVPGGGIIGIIMFER
jgi:hypothetical protein